MPWENDPIVEPIGEKSSIIPSTQQYLSSQGIAEESPIIGSQKLL